MSEASDRVRVENLGERAWIQIRERRDALEVALAKLESPTIPGPHNVVVLTERERVVMAKLAAWALGKMASQDEEMRP